jgi:hypothetical protein
MHVWGNLNKKHIIFKKFSSFSLSIFVILTKKEEKRKRKKKVQKNMTTPWLVTALLFATIHAGRCGQPSWLSRFDSVEGCETDICSGDNAGARAYRPFLPVHGVDPAFRQQSRSVGEFMASTYPANTVCTCAPSIRGNTYRVCGRLDVSGTYCFKKKQKIFYQFF